MAGRTTSTLDTLEKYSETLTTTYKCDSSLFSEREANGEVSHSEKEKPSMPDLKGMDSGISRQKYTKAELTCAMLCNEDLRRAVNWKSVYTVR